MKRWPKRPEKLDEDSYWVTVVCVVGGSGIMADELAWCTECLGGGSPVESILIDAAQSWYLDTDQSSECTVTLKAEDSQGVVTIRAIRLEWQLKAKVVP